jgi:ABC-type sugar transport system substrate-binding protein
MKYVKDGKEAKAQVEALLKDNPDLHGFYLQQYSDWVPQAIAAIKESGRNDVWAATFNMNPTCAKLLLERGPLWNIQSYAQYSASGADLVNAAAKWHLGYDLPMFATLPLVSVTPDNVEDGWRQIFQNTADAEPPWIKYGGWV